MEIFPFLEHGAEDGPNELHIPAQEEESRSGGSSVAVVILARDEERSVGDAVAGARRHAERVVVMDGRSRDTTAAVAESAGAEVHSDPGVGKGAAVRAALELVDADIVVLMDADGSHDPDDIPRLVSPVADGRAELCVGSRFAGGSDELSATPGQLVRTIGNVSMNIAINQRFGVELTDTLNGFRAVDRKAALQLGLRENTHTIEQEMVLKMLLSGLRVVNVPTHEDRRRYGTSHIKIWREWPRFVTCLIRHLLARQVDPGALASARGENGSDERGTKAAAAQTGAARRGRWKPALLLFLTALMVFNLNGRAVASYDSLAASLIPFGLWHGRGVALDDWADRVPPGIRYSMAQGRNGHWYPVYPIAIPLLVSPLYAPTLFIPRLRPDDPGVGEAVRELMEKVSASVVAALSVAVLFLALAEITSAAGAVVLALVYAFATPTWTISSQALWQHGPAELLLAATLLMLVRRHPATARAGAALGLLAGLLTAVRPLAIVYSAAIALIVLRRTGWRRFWPFAASAAAVAALLVGFNVATFGTPLGGYVHAPFPGGPEDLAPASFSLAHLAGLLLSNRGLLVFCPFFLLLLVRWRWPRRLGRGEVLLLGAAWLVTLLGVASLEFWFAGYCYGPRYLTDGLPLLVLLLAAPLESLKHVLGRAVFAAAVGVAVVIQLVGATCFPGGDSGLLLGLWDPLRSEPVMAALAGPRPPSLLPAPIPGVSMDHVLSDAEAHATLTWQPTAAQGWRRGSVHILRVRITNRSGIAWSSVGGMGGQYAVLLSAVIQPADAPPTMEQPSTARWLAFRLGPGDSVDRRVWIRAPSEPGRYVVRLQLGQSARSRLAPFPTGGAQPLVYPVGIKP